MHSSKVSLNYHTLRLSQPVCGFVDKYNAEQRLRVKTPLSIVQGLNRKNANEMPENALDLRIEQLRAAGLRPTRQRVALAELLFGRGDRHVTAEMLHAEALQNGIPVSLATIYNTIHQFVEAHLLREVAVEGSKTYFDTNTSNHFHFFFEKDGILVDIETSDLKLENLPTPPEGMEITRIDVLVRLAPRS
jgi:Fur family iron response transcriptional regulator